MINDAELNPVFEGRIAEHFRMRVGEVFSLSDTTLPTRITVQRTDEPVYHERFPAVLDWNGASPATEATLWYNHQAIEETAREFGEDAKAFASIEKLYIAGSISLGLLLNSIDLHDQNKIRLLSEQFMNMSEIEEAIDESPNFSEDDALNLKLALGKSSEDRLKRVGILRFAAGLYEFLGEETDGISLLRKSAHENIRDALRNRRMLESIINASQVMSPEEAEYRVDRQFTDAASEMSLALAFPMDTEELRAIIALATTRKTESSIVYTEEVIREFPEDGFHEVD